MSKTTKRAMTGAVIKLLCDRFPQTFSRRDPWPLKVGLHTDLLAELSDTVRARDLKTALRAYTSSARYLRSLSAGAYRVDLDGRPAGTVTPEDEAVATKRLAELANGATRTEAAPPAQAASEAPPMRPSAEKQKPAAPKRLSLADLRAAGRRRRGAAA
jgi:ProP effector